MFHAEKVYDLILPNHRSVSESCQPPLHDAGVISPDHHHQSPICFGPQSPRHTLAAVHVAEGLSHSSMPKHHV